jgi:hypothetical protein
MVGNLNIAPSFPHKVLILEKGTFKHCHIYLPDMPKPVGAIAYSGQFYSCVRLYTDNAAAQRGAQRLLERGNRVILTRVPKGLVLWVSEPDARLA